MVDTEDRYIVPALRRGLAILRMFDRARRIVTVPEMSRELGIPRGTAFRLAYTLEAEGYLARVPNSNAFQLGIGVLSLGFDYLGSLDVVEIARPVLEELRDETDASAHLAIGDGWDVVYVLSLSSRHRISGNLAVGTRMQAHENSIGHALLFDRSAEDLSALAKAAGVELAGPAARALHETIAAEAARGFVFFRGLYVPGIASVAVPVRDRSGQIVAGINVSDYETLNCFKDAEGALAKAVERAAMRIARGLGARPPDG
jgi:DNA-binding IclR family transcriptional regulator